MGNVDTVKEIYAAFGSGDIPAILGKLADDVEWDIDSPAPEVPCCHPGAAATTSAPSSSRWRRSSSPPSSRIP